MSVVDFFLKKQAWQEWHELNPHVWTHFESFAFEVLMSGRRKVSHWLLINRIRWEVEIKTIGSDFKISNDFIAFYARLWILTHPKYKHLFNIKRMHGETDFEKYK
jgi:hypothetical protein